MQYLQELEHFFQEVELPVIISDEYISAFSKENPPISLDFIEKIIPWEKDVDEFTEFIPCFRLPNQKNFIGFVYWKGGLLSYDFILATIDLKGTSIMHKSIAGTRVSDDGSITISIASIDTDLAIKIMIGRSSDGIHYSGEDSKSYYMEILENGEITIPFQET